MSPRNMLKRYREEQDMANMLLFLSTSGGHDHHQQIDVLTSRSSSPSRVFECKTCNRQFPSFQALGGHRASHKKPRLTDGLQQGQHELVKPRLHECSICGLEFAVGQALGGHMRRHRALAVPHEVPGNSTFSVKKKIVDDDRKELWIDLNMPAVSAPAEASDSRRKIFGFELVDQKSATPTRPVLVVVDCFN